MTQPRTAVKIKGEIGNYKDKKTKLYFLSQCEQPQFFVGVYYVVREVVKEGCDV